MSQLERCIHAAQRTKLSSFIPVHEIVFFFPQILSPSSFLLSPPHCSMHYLVLLPPPVSPSP